MKICAIICEFNPFHNGHKYLLEQARALSGCDALLCVMSGNFTQRGEACVLDKYARATHAVLGGADCVIELPSAFAVSPAEIFAAGAVKLLSAIPEVTHLAFGCENGDGESYLKAAQILLDENDKFVTVLNSGLDGGESYIKSYKSAFVAVGGDEELVSKPNNVLALEYVKAVLRRKKDIKIVPVKRLGAGYGDCELHENFSSASAIRANLKSDKLSENVPDYVLKDLKNAVYDEEKAKNYFKLVLSRTSAEDLRRVYGATEGLENKILSLAHMPFDEIIKKCTSRRYSSTRIRRIICENFLNLYQDDCEKFLAADLYLKPLAVNAKLSNGIFAALAKAGYPLVLKGRDRLKLDKTALNCLKKDDFADGQWQQITGKTFKSKLITVK
ncbi:MAG: nucleotidyltransferase family protein [Clostridia bacterium]|nr:nucleotidyltransferase family protein [Clostridia bacterium]